MKQYILKRKLLAEKASQKEAEQILGRKIHNFLYGSERYLIEENNEYDWMPATLFENQATLIDKPIDFYQLMLKETDKSLAYLKEQYSKETESRLKAAIFLTNKRLATLQKDICKIINLEIMTKL